MNVKQNPLFKLCLCMANLVLYVSCLQHVEVESHVLLDGIDDWRVESELPKIQCKMHPQQGRIFQNKKITFRVDGCYYVYYRHAEYRGKRVLLTDENAFRASYDFLEENFIKEYGKFHEFALKKVTHEKPNEIGVTIDSLFHKIPVGYFSADLLIDSFGVKGAVILFPQCKPLYSTKQRIINSEEAKKIYLSYYNKHLKKLFKVSISIKDIKTQLRYIDNPHYRRSEEERVIEEENCVRIYSPHWYITHKGNESESDLRFVDAHTGQCWQER